MAIALSDLIAWRDSLIESRLRGVLTVVDQNGERITYKSDPEMAKAIAAADAAISAHGRQPVKTIVFTTSKGV